MLETHSRVGLDFQCCQNYTNLVFITVFFWGKALVCKDNSSSHIYIYIWQQLCIILVVLLRMFVTCLLYITVVQVVCSDSL